MEDKKVMEFINKNHETAYNNFLKTQKKKQIKEKISNIIFSILVFAVTITLIIVVQNDTKKAMQHCINNGQSYEQCLIDIQ